VRKEIARFRDDDYDVLVDNAFDSRSPYIEINVPRATERARATVGRLRLLFICMPVASQLGPVVTFQRFTFLEPTLESPIDSSTEHKSTIVELLEICVYHDSTERYFLSAMWVRRSRWYISER
jgi:hypothetical protein